MAYNPVLTDKELRSLARFTRVDIEAFGLNWYEYSIGVEQENYANLRTASIVGDKITLTLGEAGTDANLVCARVVAMNLKKYGADYYQRLCKMRNDAVEEKEKK